jgi:hypothetical protein
LFLDGGLGDRIAVAGTRYQVADGAGERAIEFRVRQCGARLRFPRAVPLSSQVFHPVLSRAVKMAG